MNDESEQERTDPARAAAVARFTRRLSFFEEPDVASWLEQHAASWGLSLGAEIRSAVRYWMAAHTDS